MSDVEDHFSVIATRRWIQSCVIDLNLCPFARPVWEGLTFCVYEGQSIDALRTLLRAALQDFATSDPNGTPSAFVLTPHMFAGFDEYNEFQGVVDVILSDLSLHGEVQVATFHPLYVFAEHPSMDAAHFTNRSPYPMFHFLREEDVERAVAQHPDTGKIPFDNIQRLQALGRQAMVERRERCFADGIVEPPICD